MGSEPRRGRSDFVLLACGLDEKTHGLLDGGALRSMKRVRAWADSPKMHVRMCVRMRVRVRMCVRMCVRICGGCAHMRAHV